MIPFLMVSAVVPSLLLMWFFHRRDVFREPPKVLWTTFALGVLTIPGVLIVLAPVDALGIEDIGNPYARGFVMAFVHAAIPEEFFKFLVVYFYASRHPAFDEPADGVVYGAAASLGFATLENIFYVAGGGIGTAVMRALTAVPGHCFDGVIMGYFVGQAKFRPQERAKLLGAALFWPIVAHGLYDGPLMALDGVTSTGGIFLMLGFFFAEFITTAIVALRMAASLRRQQLAWLEQMRHMPVGPAGGGTAVAPAGGTTPAFPAYPQQPVAMPHPVARRPASPYPAPPAYQAAVGPARPIQLPSGQPARWPAAPAVARKGRPVKGWLLLLGALPLAAFGGLMTLGALIDFGTEDLIFLVTLGLVPLALGVLMFSRGVAAFNAA